MVPDVDEAGPVEDDKKDSPKSILTHASPGNFKDIGITSGMINALSVYFREKTPLNIENRLIAHCFCAFKKTDSDNLMKR